MDETRPVPTLVSPFLRMVPSPAPRCLRWERAGCPELFFWLRPTLATPHGNLVPDGLLYTCLQGSGDMGDGRDRRGTASQHGKPGAGAPRPPPHHPRHARPACPLRPRGLPPGPPATPAGPSGLRGCSRRRSRGTGAAQRSCCDGVSQACRASLSVARIPPSPWPATARFPARRGGNACDRSAQVRRNRATNPSISLASAESSSDALADSSALAATCWVSWLTCSMRVLI